MCRRRKKGPRRNFADSAEKVRLRFLFHFFSISSHFTKRSLWLWFAALSIKKFTNLIEFVIGMICFYLLKQIFDPRTSLSFSSSTFFSRETWLGHFQNLKFTSVSFNSVLFWVFTPADDVEMFCCCCWEMRTLEWIPCSSESPQCCLERTQKP